MPEYEVFLIDDDGNEAIVSIDVEHEDEFDSPDHFMDDAVVPAIRRLGLNPDHIEDLMEVGGDEEG